MSSAESAAPARPPRFGRFFWRDPNTQFLLLAAAAGICGGLGAIAFRFVTRYLTGLFLGSQDVVRGAEMVEPWLRVVIPAAGGLAGGLVASFFFGEKGPSGISHLIEVVSIGRRTVRVRPSLARGVSSILVISSGGSEGREGPIIQIGAAFASALARWWRLSPERIRILTACGMAAGVAGAYNTPIAATLFVLEVVVGSFSMALFGPAVVSAVVSTLLVRWVLGDEPVYQVAPFRVESALEYLPFVGIGILSGLCSGAFVRALSLAKRLFSLTKLPVWATMAIGGAVVGTIGIFLPQVFGNGFEATDRILHGNPTLVLLLVLLVAKTVATSATIGSGGVGGVFTPSLMIGAALGGVAAHLMHLAFPHLSAPVGGYALLGMGGMMAGVTRAPLLAVIMMFELTQNTAVLLPMMAVSVLAVVSAKVLQKDSIYVASLRSAGIVWEKTPEATALATLRVGDIMRRDVALIPASTPLPDVVSAFLRSRSLLLYVGDDDGRLLGAVDIHDIKESFPEKDLSALVVAADILTEIPFVTPEESLTTVNEKLWFRDVGQLPVVDSAATRKFLGIVTQRDLLGAFDSEVLRRNRLFTPVRSFGERGSGGLEFLELPESHRLVEIDVPPALEGLTVAEAAPRARFGISVLAVNRMGRDGIERRFVPGPADRFEHGDVLVVLGTDEAIAKLQDARGAPVTAG
jgi:CIC family chloride channel protein